MKNETKIIKNSKTIGGIRVCQRCGKEFVGYWNAQYCPNCLEALMDVAVEPVPKNKKAEYKPTVVKERVCTVCGVRFLGGPRAKYCPECRHEIRKQRDIEQKKRGARRPLGSIDFCKACGKEYIVNSGLQKYCPECAAEQIRERDRERGREYAAEQRKNNPERVKEWKRTKYAETTCPVCGNRFTPMNGKQLTCSEQCKVVYSKYRQLLNQWKYACKHRRAFEKPTLDSVKALIEQKNKKGIDKYTPMGYNKDKIKNGTSRKGEIEMKVINTANQKVLAEVMTNHGMTVEEALELVGIDLSHCDENDGSYKDLDGEDFWVEDCEMIY